MRLDAHHHFWRYNPDEYGWIGPDMTVLRRDYLPADLEAELHGASIDGAIPVQARQTVEETEWLLGLADEHPFIRGVVGWVPLTDPAAGEVLDRFADRPKLVGVRHVLHDEANDDYALGEAFNRGIEQVTARDLAYDILIFERHLPQAIELVDRHPNQRFIVDHIAKPRIRDRAMEPWATLIAELAQRDHVACKVSGMVTEADHRTWTADDLEPYFDVVYTAFGPQRLMFGSDWPVCRLACDYVEWAELVIEWIAAGCSAAESARILGGTAAAWYGLPEG